MAFTRLDLVQGFDWINAIVIPGHAGRVVLLNVHNKSFEDVVEGVYPFNVGMIPETLLANVHIFKGRV